MGGGEDHVPCFGRVLCVEGCLGSVEDGAGISCAEAHAEETRACVFSRVPTAAAASSIAPRADGDKTMQPALKVCRGCAVTNFAGRSAPCKVRFSATRVSARLVWLVRREKRRVGGINAALHPPGVQWSMGVCVNEGGGDFGWGK